MKKRFNKVRSVGTFRAKAKPIRPRTILLHKRGSSLENIGSIFNQPYQDDSSSHQGRKPTFMTVPKLRSMTIHPQMKQPHSERLFKARSLVERKQKELATKEQFVRGSYTERGTGMVKDRSKCVVISDFYKDECMEREWKTFKDERILRENLDEDQGNITKILRMRKVEEGCTQNLMRFEKKTFEQAQKLKRKKMSSYSLSKFGSARDKNGLSVRFMKCLRPDLSAEKMAKFHKRVEDEAARSKESSQVFKRRYNQYVSRRAVKGAAQPRRTILSFRSQAGYLGLQKRSSRSRRKASRVSKTTQKLERDDGGSFSKTLQTFEDRSHSSEGSVKLSIKPISVVRDGMSSHDNSRSFGKSGFLHKNLDFVIGGSRPLSRRKGDQSPVRELILQDFEGDVDGSGPRKLTSLLKTEVAGFGGFSEGNGSELGKGAGSDLGASQIASLNDILKKFSKNSKKFVERKTKVKRIKFMDKLYKEVDKDLKSTKRARKRSHKKTTQINTKNFNEKLNQKIEIKEKYRNRFSRFLASEWILEYIGRKKALPYTINEAKKIDFFTAKCFEEQDKKLTRLKHSMLERKEKKLEFEKQLQKSNLKKKLNFYKKQKSTLRDPENLTEIELAAPATHKNLEEFKNLIAGLTDIDHLKKTDFEAYIKDFIESEKLYEQILEEEVEMQRRIQQLRSKEKALDFSKEVPIVHNFNFWPERYTQKLQYKEKIAKKIFTTYQADLLCEKFRRRIKHDVSVIKYDIRRYCGAEFAKKEKKLKRIKIMKTLLKQLKLMKSAGVSREMFMEENPFDLKPYSRKLSRVFFREVKKGDVKEVEILIRMDKFLVYSVNHDRETGLHWACKRNDGAMAELLIEKKSDLTAVDVRGRMPYFHILKHNNYKLLMKYLYQREHLSSMKALEGYTEYPDFECSKVLEIFKIVDFKLAFTSRDEQIRIFKSSFENICKIIESEIEKFNKALEAREEFYADQRRKLGHGDEVTDKQKAKKEYLQKLLLRRKIWDTMGTAAEQ